MNSITVRTHVDCIGVSYLCLTLLCAITCLQMNIVGVTHGAQNRREEETKRGEREMLTPSPGQETLL